MRKYSSRFFKFLHRHLEHGGRRQNLSQKLTIIYLCAFAVCIILIASVSYLISSHHLEKEVNIFADSLLTQVQANIETQLSNIDNAVISTLGTTSDVRVFMNDTYGDYDEYQNVQMNLQKNLKFLRESNPYIDSIYVYSQKTKEVITEENKLSAAEQYDTAWIGPAEGQTTLWMGTREIPESIHHPTASRVITMVRKFPFNNNFSVFYGRVVVNIKEDILSQLMAAQQEISQGYVVVLDEAGELILNSGARQIETEPLRNFSPEEGQGARMRNNGEKYMVYQQKSEDLHWQYFYLMPKNVLYAPLNGMRNIFVTITVVVLLLAALLNFYLREVTYKPFDKFLRHVAEATAPEALIQPGNVREVERKFETMFSEHKLMLAQMAESRQLLKWRVLTDILLGYRNDLEDIRGQLQSLDICLGGANYIVMLVKKEESAIENYSEKKVSLYRKAMINIIEAEINSETSGAAVELYDGNLCAIVSFDQYDDQKCPTMACSMAETIRLASVEDFGVPVTIGIGRLKQSAQEIKNSFQEASSALEYEIMTGTNTVISIDDMETYDEKRLYNIMDNINNIAQSLRSASGSDYRRQIMELYGRFAKENFSPRLILQMSVQLIMNSIYVAVGMGIPIGKLLGEQFSNIYDILVEFPTVEEIRDYVMDVFDCFSETIRLKRSSKNTNEKIMEQILAYIQENYTQKNLSLNLLSSEFHFSTPYLSKLFKATMETNFLDYLINLRVSKAKELLVQTNLSSSEIAEKVGYSTYHSFMQIFKKYTGMTPSEFRNSTKKELEQKNEQQMV